MLFTVQWGFGTPLNSATNEGIKVRDEGPKPTIQSTFNMRSLFVVLVALLVVSADVVEKVELLVIANLNFYKFRLLNTPKMQ